MIIIKDFFFLIIIKIFDYISFEMLIIGEMILKINLILDKINIYK